MADAEEGVDVEEETFVIPVHRQHEAVGHPAHHAGDMAMACAGNGPVARREMPREGVPSAGPAQEQHDGAPQRREEDEEGRKHEGEAAPHVSGPVRR